MSLMQQGERVQRGACLFICLVQQGEKVQMGACSLMWLTQTLPRCGSVTDPANARLYVCISSDAESLQKLTCAASVFSANMHKVSILTLS